MAKSIREAYGNALVKYGKDDSRVVVLDADLAGSTKSGMFQSVAPERFFNMGIAEQNMCGVAAGLATCEKIPFINTFGVFISTICLLCARTLGSYGKLPLKFVGAYGGLSDAFDGPSHHSIEDIAVMRSLPNFKVFVASDERLTDWLVKNAIASPSPMYMRMSRDAFPDLYAEDTVFEEGKGMIVREGSDATIIACGLMVGNALQAAKLLEKEGIQTRVVDMFCIKPLDSELVVACAQKTGAIVTAEEHNIVGGLGGAVSEALCAAGQEVAQGFIGMRDTHAECGPYLSLQKKYGLDAEAIAAKVKETIEKKK